MARPVDPLVFLFRFDAEHDASVERHDFQLDVEALAVVVRPCAADPRPEAFLAFAVADLVGNVARFLGWWSCCWCQS